MEEEPTPEPETEVRTAGEQVRNNFQNISGGKLAPSPDFCNRQNLQQSKAEERVRKLLTDRVRRDRAIPFCLRALDRAQSELQHNSLALCIGAAAWMWEDLTVWRSYPAKFARSEAWKQIRIGLAWIDHLRRKGEGRP